MRSLPIQALSAACLLGLGSVGSTVEPSRAATTHTVTIENLQFNPAELTVHRGDKVVWVNKDFFPHTATAKDKVFDSGTIDANGSWAFKADKTGDHPYGCNFHPTMKAEIHVK
jgi:plastocyanin